MDLNKIIIYVFSLMCILYTYELITEGFNSRTLFLISVLVGSIIDKNQLNKLKNNK